MHPTVMTMLAEDRALDLRCTASAQRRGRRARANANAGARRVFTLKFPRRVAHA